ncbi:fibroin heavy chain-like [Helicoverpa zea]|uniref:fibroin heavy chain-like n=1 Tax=Helicoverpa zea TaxID=7113 RepID=UPI001F56E540|nr:fibroin heavy chain-like [Helicoverpa zea]
MEYKTTLNGISTTFLCQHSKQTIMSLKAILILCAQALLLKSAVGQCTSRAAVADASALAAPCSLAAPAWAYDGLAYPGAGLAGTGLAYNGLNAGLAGRGLAYDAIYAPAMEFSPTSGGALPVSSASAIAPVGISVVSDNVYEGVLSAAGELPFVGTVAMEGVVPSAGAGAVNHACGNGRNAMISETTGFGAAGAYGAGLGAISPAAGFGAAAYAYDGLAYPGAGLAGTSLAYNGLNAGLAGRGLAYDAIYAPAMEFSPTSGGALPVSSASAIAPVGISVVSDNMYEGVLSAAGELPFVGTVAMEGAVPSAGAGAVNHACGNGRNAMISETTGFGAAGAYGAGLGAISPAAGFGAAAYGAGIGSGLGLRSGIAGRGCGCWN